MEIRPIFASLRKHRIPAILIVLEIALACAVLCNAVFMISQRVTEIRLPNAIDEAGVVSIRLLGTDPARAASEIPRNLAALRSIAGVTAASVVSTVPLSRNNWGWSFGLTPDTGDTEQHHTNLSLYMLGEGSDKALGLQLKEGRFFRGDEYAGSTLGAAVLPNTHVVVITETMGKQLWPGQSPLGKTLYAKLNDYTVIGVVADVLRPRLFGNGGPNSYYSTFYPVSPDAALDDYVVRASPRDRNRVLAAAEHILQDLNPAAVAQSATFGEIRDDYFADMSSMAWMLVLVCVVMLAVTAFGIVGLTSFWVAQRRRQIGIRRAVGATRGHILNYFRTENFLLSTFGVGIGIVLALGINIYLMRSYEMARMPWPYLPISAVALWLLGQVAVLGPAMRAAAVPPIVATRAG